MLPGGAFLPCFRFYGCIPYTAMDVCINRHMPQWTYEYNNGRRSLTLIFIICHRLFYYL